MSIVLEVFGDFACFSPPYAKVERMTMPVPTPSAVRGILSAIYSKPAEFYWQVERIEVLNPIKYISFKCNEVKATVSDKPICADDERTQRQTVMLQDVRYRITASVRPRESFRGNVKTLYGQALRRIRTGKCFYQPSLGIRGGCECYFEESDMTRPPISVDMDLGLCVYDVFDLHDFSVSKKAKPALSLFHGVMRKGIIDVPPYDSPEVMKGGSMMC